MATRTLRAGIIAGLVGGAIDSIFLVVVSVLSGQSLAASVIGMYQFAAAGAIGKSLAFSSPAFAWLGLPVHFAVSIAWALGFVYLAQRRRQLIERPLISGVAFGFVVWIMMQIVLIGAGLFQNPTPSGLAIALLAHCVFFGIPVAYTNARLSR